MQIEAVRKSAARKLLLLAAIVMIVPGGAWAGLVTNPGFETRDFSGWTRSGNLGSTFVECGVPASAHTGNCFGAFGPVGSFGYISQTLTTSTGALYDLSFWALAYAGTAEVWWDGALIFTGSTDTETIWTKFAFDDLVASGGSTELKLGFWNDPSDTYVDDISVLATGATVPEPSTVILNGLGLAALALYALRRRCR